MKVLMETVKPHHLWLAQCPLVVMPPCATRWRIPSLPTSVGMALITILW